VGAHLVELRRTRAGSFRVEDAITLDHLSELSESKLTELNVISPDAALSHLPAIELTADEVTQTIHGIDLTVDDDAVVNWQDGAAVRMRAEGNELIAVGAYDESRKVVHPKVVIATDVSEARP
jgi:tRNA U55 pseudouridine synthase TruB